MKRYTLRHSHTIKTKNNLSNATIENRATAMSLKEITYVLLLILFLVAPNTLVNTSSSVHYMRHTYQPGLVRAGTFTTLVCPSVSYTILNRATHIIFGNVTKQTIRRRHHNLIMIIVAYLITLARLFDYGFFIQSNNLTIRSL